MRRKPHHPIPMSHHTASAKRSLGPHGSSSTLPTPKAVIDQRLIEGAQIPHHRRMPQENELGTVGPESQPELPSRADDLQLDAFDLELLAHSDGNYHTVARQLTTVAYPSNSREEAPRQVSRFFQSSSSDLGLRSPSSPLSRLHAAKTNAPLRGQHCQAEKPQIQDEELPFHDSSTVSLGSDRAQRSPFQNIPMSIRGIVLVSVHELPDSYRSIFHFPVFNAVQSKCFQHVYKTDDNIVLAAPTGSGKTVIMELAICRLLSTLKDERFKVVYQAPTKSLCSERFRDWNRKFMSLGLQCAELTGDTDYTQLRSVQNSQIIVTTPEKWDSMTRKWKDHARLMQLVKLFLIDEVHILKEGRGATLEAVVSRMKTFGSNVRFVALSATVPNSEDIATWLGKDATNQHVPAHREHFGEEFRPVKLQKFVYGYQSHSNDFAFDKLCSSKLPDVLGTHSCRKPIMIFCCTRNSCVATAKELARLWSMTNPPARLWKGSGRRLEAHNADLRATLVAGVAFHHAGLDSADRYAVETGYLQGHINVICCTSTLAVGVNLPCHLVIVKGTAGWQDGGCKEYSDLEIMQMLGRAGRPQFDDSAIAVIMTRKERVQHYEKLASGSETLESCLHLNLIDHLNAEIGLGNVADVDSAVRWLAGTFLFVRLRRNPKHYQLKEGATKDDEDEMLRQICEKDIRLLQETGLVASDCLKSTSFGDAMARYYVRFETMKTLLALEPHATVSQVLFAIAEAEEFREIRLKAGEKSLYKELNRANGIRFAVKVDIALPAHKILLLIQSELGAVEYPDGDQYQKHKFAFQQDKAIVFSHINRLIRCVIDCQISREDSIATRNALELARSFGAKVWDTSPLQMKQIDQIGIVAVRKLAAAGVTSIDALEDTEPHRIDMILSRNPPFGMKILGRVAEFPKLRVSVKLIGKVSDIKPGKHVKVRFKAEIAFINEKTPTFYQRRPVYVCFLAEISDGRLIDFRRISANKLKQGQEILLNAELKSPGHCITCYVMCDDIAGTLRYAEIKPELANVLFPYRPCERAEQNPQTTKPTEQRRDDIDNDDWLFDDFLEAGKSKDSRSSPERIVKSVCNGTEEKSAKEIRAANPLTEAEKEPARLENGRWACNHRCKDKTTCKHLCCREGLEKPHKATRKQSHTGNQSNSGLNQLTLSASMPKKDHTKAPTTETSAPTSDTTKSKLFSPLPQQDQQHSDITDLGDTINENFSTSLSKRQTSSSDYGDDSFDDLPSPSALLLGLPMKIPVQGNKDATRKSADFVKTIETDDPWTEMDEPFTYNAQPSPIETPGQADDQTSKAATSPLKAPEQTPTPSSEFKVGQELDLAGFESSPVLVLDVDEHVLDTSGQRGQKRCMSWGCEDEDESTDARTAKRNRLSKSCKDDGVTTKLRESAHEPTTLPEGPRDWDGIDPALLHEFKDIVDFF
ncbi:putative DEAD/DEAH box DNA helicase (Mer3) [Aspergillus clavatus NRRL 1]|uniref:DNA 3'-5' helicase n=1 Tax=Aspergillus clavatus (strain ATCC 1007 / CBS 513.65 / DSM 816 / NCTC 3887 / NRRL 1 / QM 1276 / 107) TaxID=344612 RepID=A1CUE7_ASPCL|nr:DEAD/DEAH box DNA helicase (Mer3), putative [Aspergillus clavatus NRRL 1]EAW06934.1 DEAD/DEAH box DNA helicase (Mer3), putative [Aspergillus clavatus NRRL 1]